MARFTGLLFSEDFYAASMEFQRNMTISMLQMASNMGTPMPMTLSTSLLSDSTGPFVTSTKGKTTAAIIPSTAFPGVDIVINEKVDI